MNLLFSTMMRFAILCGSVEAANYDGNRMAQICAGDRSFVLGYVAGMLDKATDDVGIASVHLAGDQRLGPMLFTIEAYCLPKGVVLSQALDVYCKYLRENPAERHQTAPILFSQSLSKMWPCSK
jgi:hypothetical protein